MPYKFNPFTNQFDYYVVGAGDLDDALAAGNSAGVFNIDMNNNDLLNVDNIDLVTINGAPYPPSGSTEDLSTTLAAGNSAGLNDIDLNNNDLLNVDKIDFNLATIDTAGEGQFAWNDVDGTLDLGLKGGNTTLNVGQEVIVRVVNKTTPLVPLTQAGYQAVIVAGATGQRLSVRLAKADSDLNSVGTLGLVCEDIAVNQEGFITTVGRIREVNTTGALQGETWADGDILYLSPTVFGAITNVKPVAPDHLVIIGYVEYAHNVHGKIYVKIDNGYELDELHNVLITSVAKGDMLEYDGTKWVNSGIVYTIELMDVLTVDFYAPYDMKINTVTNIKNSPTTTIQDDGVAYTLTNTILLGSKVTVTVNTAGVVNLNITKA